MLDLAIPIDTDTKGTNVIETNHGVQLKAAKWPQDCEFQLVAFNPAGKTCKVISTEQLVNDIRDALKSFQAAGTVKTRKPDWYHRLALYAEGASQG